MKIEMFGLMDALAQSRSEISYFFDRQTGTVIPCMGGYDMDDEEDDDYEIRNNPDRYIYIEPIDSRTGFRIMERFVLDLPDGPEKELLDRALSWKKPFSNFKNALYEFPELKDDWRKHHDDMMRAKAIAWLADHDIAVDDITDKE